MIKPGQRVHFIGAGGGGMSALAEVLVARGYTVSGCDSRESRVTQRLRQRGVKVKTGHSPSHLEGIEAVVVSRAIRDENEELKAAHARGISVYHRAEVLGHVLRDLRSIAIVGTHGKSTTSAMTAVMLAEGGLDPTALVGADVLDFNANVRMGRSDWGVAEVDESDGSLVHVKPYGVVLTSLDLTDHADFYATRHQLEDTFRAFLRGMDGRGFAVLCADHPGVLGLADAIKVPVVTYGLGAGADLTGDVQELEEAHSRVEVRRRGAILGEIALKVPGRYNVANALAATAVGLQVGIPFGTIARALGDFRGVSRRFEVRGKVDDMLVVDDYAHNPVKVAAVLRATKECWPGRRVIAIFQPHRYSRTKTTHAQFADAFVDADQVYVTEIYPADEPPIPGVTAQLIVDAIKQRREVSYVPEPADVVGQVARDARPGDLILTLGAGDIWTAADEIVEQLRARPAPAAPQAKR